MRWFHSIFYKTVRPAVGKCGSESSSSQPLATHYKRWYQLQLSEKQQFITRFVHNYKVQYPRSKTNVSLRELSHGMDQFQDSPSVFGIFYEDIWRRALEQGGPRTGSRFDHPSFLKLLVERREPPD
ncbi:Mlo1p KNAG_0J00510 [Huiozyma naganishii CBS 8797]|uniref:Uncharacterized protein n=1 Tax=Huiozyma naganishii (strain ATCC MYA-139 / BCRC 22969 / CBS 8797 / KCTC 17520 / NBRC 10181 / NCYC 3082 / Yp74L-3) TaxID=1071383 RepID=J7S9I7_HUIN7|nr:hypothetical protein KNAG_0J00510 [Kazachstania naganishii CBS 8797]CCK72134.1 hypothetical protein KNAG_0J00510 [Kazachstania naganishii CBS 8797]